MQPDPNSLPARMSRWRHRVVGASLSVFAVSWLAVLGLGHQGRAGAATRTSTQPAAPATRTTAQAITGDDGTVYQYPDGTYGYGSGSGGGTQAGPSASSNNQSPLVTQQS
jgi:hypothetical protein